MPKRNYQFEKRQKDLARKQKKEEKRQRKIERAKGSPEEPGDQVPPPVPVFPDQGQP